MPVIKIESILGGHAPSTHFAGKDQFRASLGIDPRQGIADSGIYASFPSGLLKPVGVTNLGTTVASIKWFVNEPKGTGAVYAYASTGSVYTLDANGAIGELSDGGNEAGTGSGNGAGYYDNYVYFAKNTTIARYGPLNGVATLNGDYWGTTLAKTALVHTTYTNQDIGLVYPNHILHRHSDGRLYIADVVDNKGTIHYIATTKATVEGDTDNSSTYNKVQVGYGLWPTALETYGSDLAIALVETPSGEIGR